MLASGKGNVMPNDLLRTHVTNPIEREYEGWVMDQIEDYFLSVRRLAITFAVSPTEEHHWPADEVVFSSGKIVGLQFKVPHLSPRRPQAYELSELNWHLSKPAGQLGLVLNHPEIFYCLPTFLNRRYHGAALHHCLFWRPVTTSDQPAWYDNPHSKSAHKKVADSSRWGRLVEDILECPVGLPLSGNSGPNSFSGYIEKIQRQLVELKQKSHIAFVFIPR